LLAGCTRAHYRQQADAQTYPIIAERIVYPSFDIGRMQVEPFPASRLADPYPPDCPPKPPDDPAAALFMERPGGMRGAKHWEKDGVTDIIEPPGWETVLEPNQDGVVRLNPDKAVEVALLNSREYQTELEDVYLAALALTLNRFEFDLQWFLRNSTTFTHFGSGGEANGETNTLQVDTNFGFSRSLAAGGQLLVDFANSLVYEYTGDTRRFSSNLLISLIQPLLRGAGRKVRLEALTQQERNVLYTVRDFARFRKRFWTNIAIDSGNNGGYLNLLLALQTIRNNQANLKRQEETYRLYNELFLGGRASAVELDQFFQSLQGARLGVIRAETDFNNRLDQFKLQLGLPPRLPIELDDSLLSTFVLVDPELEKARDDLEAFQRQRLAELDEPSPVDVLKQHFRTLLEFVQRAPEMLRRAEADLARWNEQLQRPAQPGDDPEARERALGTFELIQQQVPGLIEELKEITESIQQHEREVTEETRQALWESLHADIKIVLADLDTIVAIQTQAKIHLIELPAVEIDAEEALAEAKENRLDLQNQLAGVTDAWRKVTVAANALKADLDVVASANLGTDPDHLDPFNFASEASSYRVGIQFDGPLNRMAERNLYRVSLINYQRARRAYMALSDQIEFQVRNDLRTLNLTRLSFEISRQQLLSAARQFENARIILLGPRERRSANDTTTLNLLQALSALVNARNELAQNYINYEQQRVQLLLDLEALQLDPRGFPLSDSLRTTDRAGAAHPVAPEEVAPPQPGAAAPGQPGAIPDQPRPGANEPDALPPP
jgi:outer membrane protein TolC